MSIPVLSWRKGHQYQFIMRPLYRGGGVSSTQSTYMQSGSQSETFAIAATVFKTPNKGTLLSIHALSPFRWDRNHRHHHL